MPKLKFGGIPPTILPDYALKTNVDGDTYFTKSEVAKSCHDKFCEYLESEGVDLSQYTWLEPSAGGGAFFNLMPDNKIGLDITPRCEGVIEGNFLEWHPPNDNKMIVEGNVPFGVKGSLALAFFERLSYMKVDYIAMILPMSFSGEVMAKRIPKFHAVYTEQLPAESFESPDGVGVKVHTIFQIWKRGESNEVAKSCDSIVDIYDIDIKKGGHLDKIGKCDIYIKSSYSSLYLRGENVSLSMDEFGYERSHGIVFKKYKDELMQLLMNHKWHEMPPVSGSPQKRPNGYTSLIHITANKLKKVIMDYGFYDTNDTCDSYVEIYTIECSDNKKAGFKKHEELGGDVFLDLDFYKDPPKIFFEIPSGKFYVNVIKIKKCRDSVINYLNSVDWSRYSMQKMNHQHSIKKRHIKQAIIDGGFTDDKKTCDSFILDVFSREDYPNTKRNLDRSADFWIQRKFHKKIKSSTNLEEMDSPCLLGVVIGERKDEIIDILRNVDWKDYSPIGTSPDFLHNIPMGAVRSAIIDKGFYDDNEKECSAKVYGLCFHEVKHWGERQLERDGFDIIIDNNFYKSPSIYFDTKDLGDTKSYNCIKFKSYNVDRGIEYVKNLDWSLYGNGRTLKGDGVFGLTIDGIKQALIDGGFYERTSQSKTQTQHTLL